MREDVQKGPGFEKQNKLGKAFIGTKQNRNKIEIFHEVTFPFVSVWATTRAPVGAQQHRFGE